MHFQTVYGQLQIPSFWHSNNLKRWQGLKPKWVGNGIEMSETPTPENPPPKYMPKHQKQIAYR